MAKKVLDVSSIEGSIPFEFGADAALVRGAKPMLASLQTANARWAIVTSGTRALVEGWLDIMELDHPNVMVVAEDCETGKPDAEPYLLAKKRLSLSAETMGCVVEDSTADVISGRASGCKVIALTTTHSALQLRQAGADWIVKDLRSVEVTGHDPVKICNSVSAN